MQKSAGGSSSNGNGGEKIENADGSVTYQDPLDMYCEDNPETDECRSACSYKNHHQTCHQTETVAKELENNSMGAVFAWSQDWCMRGHQ